MAANNDLVSTIQKVFNALSDDQKTKLKEYPAEEQQRVLKSLVESRRPAQSAPAKVTGRAAGLPLELGSEIARTGGVRAPLQSAGAQLGQDVAGAFEGATLGLPRIGLQALGGPQLPRGSVLGQIAGFAAPNAGLARLGKLAIPSTRALPTISRGMLEGGVGGFIFPQETLGAPERGTLALGGAALGAGTGVLSGMLGAVQRARGARNALQQIETQKLNFKLSPQAVLPQTISKEIQFLGEQKTALIRQESKATGEQIDILKQAVQKEAETRAGVVKKPLLGYMRNFKEDWGERLGELLRSARGTGVPKAKVEALADSVVDSLVRSGVDPNTSTVVEIGSIIKRLSQSKSKQVSYTELMQMRRRINEALSSRARSGAGFSEHDLAGIAFNKSLGDLLKGKVEGLAPLFNEYAKFSDLSKFVYKNFKPRGTEFELVQGTSFFKRLAEVGKKGLDIGERKALAELERRLGIKLGGNVEQLGKQLKQLPKEKAARIGKIQADMEKRIAELRVQQEAAKRANLERSVSIDREIDANQKILSDFRLMRNVLGTLGVTGAAAAGLRRLFRQE